MKKLLLLIFIPILISCTASREDKAKTMIQEYLKETLNDSESYEPMHFYELSPHEIRYFEDSLYMSIDKMCVDYGNKVNIESGEIDRLNREYNGNDSVYLKIRISKLKLMSDSAIYFYNTRDSIEKHFKPYNKGYELRHKFRASNKFGAKEIYSLNFIFDNNISYILSVKDDENIVFDMH